MGTPEAATTTLTLLHALVAVGVLAVVVGITAVGMLRPARRTAPVRAERRTTEAPAHRLVAAH